MGNTEIGPEREIGSLLAKARNISNITMKQIAERIGIRDSNIGKWESGVRLPPLKRAAEIARVYGLDEEYFRKTLADAWKRHRELSSNCRSLFRTNRVPSTNFNGALARYGFGKRSGVTI